MFVFEDKQQHPETHLKNDMNAGRLPPLISDVITDPKHYIDNLFADTWKKLKLNSLIRKSGFTKRSGVGITEAVFLLLLWKWLNMSSIAMFSKKALGTFSSANKDVMYDLLKREEINWRELNIRTAKSVYQQRHLVGSRLKALVLDDSIKTRRGKKMEGVSSHFDHVTGRHVMGQQVLTLGLATEEAFLPLDSQIYISQTKARKLIKPYKDGRSVVGQRYREATTQSKPEMAANMMKRAMRSGMEADYVVADAWFGTKPGAADKAANLGGCKSLCRQLPVNGRLAYPLLGEATNRDMRGRRSHGCPTRERRGGSNLGGEQISGPEDHRMTAAPRTQTLQKLL